ncbi:uncharacterized protein LOC134571970 [Pelobates fuscus]|uniref:uncharacterized protein LOC134571970 n=1 Tax=Pelobates fuscus TaxID=191477 RepID=UPI002FE4C4DD
MMCPGRNVIGILLWLSIWYLCVLKEGRGSFLLPNKDILDDEDIQKQVDQALQLVNKDSFQGWPLEQIKQAVPRLHIGLIEIWLQFRKLLKEQNEVWTKLRRMTRQSAVSCQEVKAEMSDFSGNLTSRMDAIENQVAEIQRKAESVEEVCRCESRAVSENQLDVNQTDSRQQPAQTTTINVQGKNNSSGSNKRYKANVEKLSQKVASLTELLNGHNELLVELYQRIAVLEGTQNTQRVLTDVQEKGRGDN